MPRGKAIKFPSPEDVGKKLAKRERELQKQHDERIKALVLKIGPTLIDWADDEKTKHIGTDQFKSPEEQDEIAKLLSTTRPPWKVESKGDGIEVFRPVSAMIRKPAAKAPKQQAKGVRRAGRDPAAAPVAAAG